MLKVYLYDRAILTVVTVLLTIGVTMVFSATALVDTFLIFKQISALLIGITGAVILFSFDIKKIANPIVIYSLIALNFVVLVATLFSPAIRNVHRWIFIGPFSVQTSEFAKLSLILFTSYVIAKYPNLKTHEFYIASFMGSAVILLIYLQPDLSTAFLIAFTVGLLMVVGGIPFKILLAGSLILSWFVVVAILFSSYRLKRIYAFLNPETFEITTNFQTIQSLIAIGSGGVWGKGLGQGVQKVGTLPLAYSDFMFAVIGEELGFVGSVFVLILFLLLLFKGIRRLTLVRDKFSFLVGVGCITSIVLTAFIHISVNLGILPSTGVPLPFISLGGSSLIANLWAIGLFMGVARYGSKG